MANSQSEIIIGLRAETADLNRKFDQVERMLGGVEKKVGVSIDSVTRDFKRMEAAVDPAAKATQRFEKDIELLDKALKAGTVTKQRAAQLTEIITQRHQQAALATRGYALAATRGLNSSRAMGTAIQQAGYQVGDFAVQVASGQSAMRAFIQQGTQLVSMFGPYGAVAGAVLAIGGAIWTAFDRSGESAEAAVDGAEDYSSSLEVLKDSLTRVKEAQRELNDELNDAGVDFLKAQLSAAVANEEIVKRQVEAAVGAVTAEKYPGRTEEELSALRSQLLGNFFDELAAAQRSVTEAKHALTERLKALDEISKLESQKKVKDLVIEGDILRELSQQYMSGVITLKQYNAELKIRNKLASSKMTGRELADYEAELREQEKLTAAVEEHTEAINEQEKRRSDLAKMVVKYNKKIATETERAANKAATSWQKQFSKMEDAIIEFSRTGKVSFTDLANSIIEDLVRIQIRSSITEPLSKGLGSMFGSFSFDSLFSMFGGSSSGPGSGYTSVAASGLHAATGGQVMGPGTGTSDSIMAWLSNGEYVINAESTKRHRGLLEAINSGKLRGFATGGPVGSGGGSGGAMVNIYDQRSGDAAPIEAQERTGPDGMREIAIFVRDTVRRQIANGEHDSVAGSRWGVTPSLVRRG